MRAGELDEPRLRRALRSADVERFSAHYRVSAPLLDIDALLAAARPTGAFERWRRGDPVGDDGRRALTSGVQIEIGDFDDGDALADAIDAFLDAEAKFVEAARRASSDEVVSVLACALWVYPDEPTTLPLPPELLRRLADAGVGVEIGGYPRIED